MMSRRRLEVAAARECTPTLSGDCRAGKLLVALALVRLSATGEPGQTGSKYTLATAGKDGPLPVA